MCDGKNLQSSDCWQPCALPSPGTEYRFAWFRLIFAALVVQNTNKCFTNETFLPDWQGNFCSTWNCTFQALQVDFLQKKSYRISSGYYPRFYQFLPHFCKNCTWITLARASLAASASAAIARCRKQVGRKMNNILVYFYLYLFTFTCIPNLQLNWKSGVFYLNSFNLGIGVIINQACINVQIDFYFDSGCHSCLT